MRWIVGSFAFLTAVAGGFYLCYSQAAHRLANVEENASNRRRVRLRQVNGLAMVVLAVLFFAGFNSVDADATPRAYLAVWMGVLLVLLVIMALAMLDLRLTMNLRRQLHQNKGKLP